MDNDWFVVENSIDHPTIDPYFANVLKPPTRSLPEIKFGMSGTQLEIM
jgi:hypothetical protein